MLDQLKKQIFALKAIGAKVKSQPPKRPPRPNQRQRQAMSETTPIEAEEATEAIPEAHTAQIRGHLSGEVAEIPLPMGEIDRIKVSVAVGETRNERIWSPEYLDTEGWELSVTDNTLTFEIPEDIPEHNEYIVTVEYK